MDLKKYATILMLLVMTYHATVHHFIRQDIASICQDNTEKKDGKEKAKQDDHEYGVPSTLIPENGLLNAAFTNCLQLCFPQPLIDNHTPPPDAPVLV